MLRCTIIPAAALAVAFSGCYSPSPPSGAYLCGSDDACPSSQHCTCGQCVNHDADAACKFAVTFPGVSDTPSVAEHQPLAISIQALTASAQPASGFNGTVTLSSSWGDVKPPTVTLTAGATSTMISLNRETLPPAVAKLTVAVGHGPSSVSTGIKVTTAPFVVSTNQIQTPFGWATRFVAEPSVLKVADGYRMYFIGSDALAEGIGVATSSDAITWTPSATPLLKAPDNTSELFSPTAYTPGSQTVLAYSQIAGAIQWASSADGLSGFMAQSSPLMTSAQCSSYCSKTVTFPQVLPDLLAGAPDGGTPPWLMFFSAIRADTQAVSIGRASSADGIAWTPEPAPVLQGDLNGEAVLVSPRVLLDGSVYKMWYSVASVKDITVLSCNPPTVNCPATLTCDVVTHTCQSPSDDTFSAFCENGITVDIGYATSSDGFFWTRSESNPVLTVQQASPADHAVLVSSVMPADGSDPASGITVYYSPFRRASVLNNRCVPNGIAHASRP